MAWGTSYVFFADDAVLMYDNPLGGGGVASGDRNATRLFLVLDNANHTTNNCMYMYIYIYIYPLVCWLVTVTSKLGSSTASGYHSKENIDQIKVLITSTRVSFVDMYFVYVLCLTVLVTSTHVCFVNTYCYLYMDYVQTFDISGPF